MFTPVAQGQHVPVGLGQVDKSRQNRQWDKDKSVEQAHRHQRTEKQWPGRSGMRTGQCNVTEAKGRKIRNAAAKEENLT